MKRSMYNYLFNYWNIWTKYNRLFYCILIFSIVFLNKLYYNMITGVEKE